MLLTIAATSCVYDFDPQVKGDGGILVVDGDILAGEETAISLTQTMALDTLISRHNPLPGTWEVSLELEDGTSMYAVKSENVFHIDTRQLSAGMKCRLHISNYILKWNYDMPMGAIQTVERRYETPWLTVQATSKIDSVSSVISEDLMTIDFCVTTSGQGSTRYYRWSGQEDWEYTADLHAYVYYYPKDRNMREYENGENSFYCWDKADVPEIMLGDAGDLSDPRFKNHAIYTYDNHNVKLSYMYSVLLIQENLSEEAYRYWSAMKRNSTDVGGLFASQPSELHGNVYNVDDPSETVIGYVNASEVSSFRYFFDSSRHMFYHRAERFSEEPKVVHRSDWFYYYNNLNYRPFGKHEEEQPNGERTSDDNIYDWYPRRCIDCTMKGGTKAKPSFWPNDHK